MLNDLLHILLGGALVALGVLAMGLSDRIRGLRAGRPAVESATRNRPPVGQTRQPIEVVEPEIVPMPPPKAKRPASVSDSRAGDVIAALVAAGYKKSVAAEAVWACADQERATVEMWVRAALRRCAGGAVMS
jgi:hypothetical protein